MLLMKALNMGASTDPRMFCCLPAKCWVIDRSPYSLMVRPAFSPSNSLCPVHPSSVSREKGWRRLCQQPYSNQGILHPQLCPCPQSQSFYHTKQVIHDLLHWADYDWLCSMTFILIEVKLTAAEFPEPSFWPFLKIDNGLTDMPARPGRPSSSLWGKPNGC